MCRYLQLLGGGDPGLEHARIIEVSRREGAVVETGAGGAAWGRRGGRGLTRGRQTNWELMKKHHGGEWKGVWSSYEVAPNVECNKVCSSLVPKCVVSSLQLSKDQVLCDCCDSRNCRRCGVGKFVNLTRSGRMDT